MEERKSETNLTVLTIFLFLKRRPSELREKKSNQKKESKHFDRERKLVNSERKTF